LLAFAEGGEGLPSSKIQETVRLDSSVSGGMDESMHNLDSDGNRVNLGNFNTDGLNVNNYWDSNCYDNLAVSSSRHSFSH